MATTLPRALLLTLLAGCGGSGGGQAPTSPATPIQVLAQIERELTVCTVQGQALKADWVRPAPAVARHRAVLFVHGGGWSTGSRSDYEPLALALAAQGYGALLADYRLAPTVHHPAAVQDLNCALRWLRQRAQALDIDPERVAVIGGSAGAHLAGWVAYGRDDPDLDGPGLPQGLRARVVTAVLHAGPHDFSALDQLGADARGAVYALLGTRAPTPAQLRDASTISRVAPGAVPTLILHGELDPLVPPDQARRLDTALALAGATHQLVLIPGAGHADFGADPEAIGQLLVQALQTHL